MPDADHYVSKYNSLVDALVIAASTLHDNPDLIDRNAIVLALCEAGIWPAHIRENAA